MNTLRRPRFHKAPCGSRGISRRSASLAHPLSPSRPAFTLTELLISVAIILILVAMVASAVSAARTSTKASATRATIDKLNTIISQQYASYASRSITSATTSSLRASAIRRIITCDMPDSWDDVARIASGTTRVLPGSTNAFFPNTATQSAYAAIWNSLPANRKDKNDPVNYVGVNFGDAECLFMAIMRGGIADCLDCGALRTTDIGDQDSDGMPEFLDAWGNPIRYVLWPGGLQLPAGSGNFFFSQTDVPFFGSPTGRVMRPLIFSGGPDQTNSTAVNRDSYLDFGLGCGNPGNTFGGLDGSPDYRADNITNLDAEAKATQ